jgi:type IV pilus assembly protein PilV
MKNTFPSAPLCVLSGMSQTRPQRRLSVRHGRKALGFTLLEVLVALLVLAFGFLAVAGVQLRALKTNFSSAQKSQATMLSYLILDAMRANRDQALAGAYNTPTTCTVPTGSTLVLADQSYWLQKAKAALGASTCAAIACDTAGNCTVTLQWDDSRAGGSSTENFVLTSRL